MSGKTLHERMVRESGLAIDAAAAAWAARLDRGSMSPQDLSALATWAAADARRHGALARALAVLFSLDRLNRSDADDDPPSPRAGRA